MVNYKPKGHNATKIEYEAELEAARNREQVEKHANYRLRMFLPFL